MSVPGSNGSRRAVKARLATSDNQQHSRHSTEPETPEVLPDNPNQDHNQELAGEKPPKRRRVSQVPITKDRRRSFPSRGESSSSQSAARSTTPTNPSRPPTLSPSPPPSKGRLPPRSRNGCWTCRTRKVKCDEKRPKCGQCDRLSHCCDYTARISFRDDTQRIVGRMQDVSTKGSSVWDPEANFDLTRDGIFANYPPGDPDNLPPFVCLTNDDERERKALGEKPGTYNLVCSPESFADPQVGAEEMEDVGGDCVASGATSPQQATQNDDSSPGFPWNSIINLSPEPEDDPNTVFLKRFDEPPGSRGLPSPPALAVAVGLGKTKSPRPHRRGRGSGGAGRQPADVMPSACHSDSSELVARDLERHRKDIAPRITKKHDAILLPKALVPVGELDLDPFEFESISFPPLFHSIVSLSALSSSRYKEGWVVDALEHYRQALPTLRVIVKGGLDLSTDGILFTHFILLIFEILSVDHWRESMWRHHLSQLGRLLVTRAELRGKERLPYLVWSIVLIDTYATLTAGGSGELSDALAHCGLIPTPRHITRSIGHSQTPESVNLFQEVLGLEQNVAKFAGKLGQLSNKMRNQAAAGENPVYGDGENECCQIVYELKGAWQARQPRVEHLIAAAEGSGSPGSAASASVFPRIQETYQHACALYNAAIIFAYTSVFPLQRNSLSIDKVEEVQTSIAKILGQASSLRETSPSQALDQRHRYMLFPLFLAGVEAPSPADKMWVQDRLKEFQEFSVGRNTKFLSTVFREIYHHQQQGRDVDWIEFMNDKEWRVVIYDI